MEILFYSVVLRHSKSYSLSMKLLCRNLDLLHDHHIYMLSNGI